MNAGDPQRSQYLELCQNLIDHAQLMRNYAMKPGNVWMAKDELIKITQLISELESLLDQIKAADQA